MIRAAHHMAGGIAVYLMTACADARGMLEDRRPWQALWLKANDASCVAPGIHRRQLHAAGQSAGVISRWSCTTFTVFGGIDLFLLPGNTADVSTAPTPRALRRSTPNSAELFRTPSQTLKPIARRKVLGFSMLDTIAVGFALARTELLIVRDIAALAELC